MGTAIIDRYIINIQGTKDITVIRTAMEMLQCGSIWNAMIMHLKFQPPQIKT